MLRRNLTGDMTNVFDDEPNEIFSPSSTTIINLSTTSASASMLAPNRTLGFDSSSYKPF